ncbi:MAG TPA: ArsC/Spx/MgsR family protein [Nocardioidaceae bacterium]
MEVWANPSCSKSRAALARLDEAGVDHTVRRYLDDPPTAAELTAVLDRLGLEPWDLARTGEPVAAQTGLRGLPRDAGYRDRWIATMVEHPILIQRPVLLASDGSAVLGRDPESVERAVAAER